jgi:hypothetical protein
MPHGPSSMLPASRVSVGLSRLGQGIDDNNELPVCRSNSSRAGKETFRHRRRGVKSRERKKREVEEGHL